VKRRVFGFIAIAVRWEKASEFASWVFRFWFRFWLPPSVAQNGNGFWSRYLVVGQGILPLGCGVYSRGTGFLGVRQMWTCSHARGALAAIQAPGTCPTNFGHTSSQIGIRGCGTPRFHGKLVHLLGADKSRNWFKFKSDFTGRKPRFPIVFCWRWHTEIRGAMKLASSGNRNQVPHWTAAWHKLLAAQASAIQTSCVFWWSWVGSLRGFKRESAQCS